MTACRAAATDAETTFYWFSYYGYSGEPQNTNDPQKMICFATPDCGGRDSFSLEPFHPQRNTGASGIGERIGPGGSRLPQCFSAHKRFFLLIGIGGRVCVAALMEKSAPLSAPAFTGASLPLPRRSIGGRILSALLTRLRIPVYCSLSQGGCLLGVMSSPLIPLNLLTPLRKDSQDSQHSHAHPCVWLKG